MPPKKGGPSSQTQNKAKAKIAEDKTFGLKNKNKSTKVAKFVQQVQKAVQEGGNRKDKLADDSRKKQIADRKAAEEAKKRELAELFKPVAQQQKVPFGVDPKTIVCVFFKSQSGCDKGSKCKFSHDLALERKAAKADLYTDSREKKDETMEDWDQEKLEQVVNSKHGALNKPTEIVCKFFLDAIETGKYGWFWECPNGGSKCKYRHALPPGFVLKKKETLDEKREREDREKENQITIEEFLETERHNLGPNLTPITFETFTAWKAARQKAQLETEAKTKEEKAQAYKMRKDLRAGGMSFSGRELFDFNPEWAVESDDDGGQAMGADEYLDRSEDEGEIPDGTMHAPKFEDAVDEELFGEEDLEGLDESASESPNDSDDAGEDSGEDSDIVDDVADGIKKL